MARSEHLRDHLPRWQPWTIERVLALAGSVAGLAALAVTFFKLDHLADNQQALILITELSIVCVGLVTYLYVTNRKKLHRYAQAVFYIHYINHIIRDELASIHSGD